MPGLPSYANGASTAPLLGETIGANLERMTAAFPDREALVSVHQDVRYTYDRFDAAVDRVALGLLSMGLGTGDRVGIWSPNYAEWALVQYATAKLGVILVNINPAYRTHELAYVLNQSGCRWIIAATLISAPRKCQRFGQACGRDTQLDHRAQRARVL